MNSFAACVESRVIHNFNHSIYKLVRAYRLTFSRKYVGMKMRKGRLPLQRESTYYHGYSNLMQVCSCLGITSIFSRKTYHFINLDYFPDFTPLTCWLDLGLSHYPVLRNRCAFDAARMCARRACESSYPILYNRRVGVQGARVSELIPSYTIAMFWMQCICALTFLILGEPVVKLSEAHLCLGPGYLRDRLEGLQGPTLPTLLFS